MNLKKKVKSIVALSLILGGTIANSNIISFADTKLDNSQIELDNSQVITDENGDIVIVDGDVELRLTPISCTVEDKNGVVRDLEKDLRDTTFTVQLGSTVTKGYIGQLSLNGKLTTSANIDIKVKCTGARKILATSHISSLKSHDTNYTASSGVVNGNEGEVSSTSARISATSKFGTRYDATFKSLNTVKSSSGSAQGYQVQVTQSFYR